VVAQAAAAEAAEAVAVAAAAAKAEVDAVVSEALLRRRLQSRGAEAAEQGTACPEPVLLRLHITQCHQHTRRRHSRRLRPRGSHSHERAVAATEGVVCREWITKARVARRANDPHSARRDRAVPHGFLIGFLHRSWLGEMLRPRLEIERRSSAE